MDTLYQDEIIEFTRRLVDSGLITEKEARLASQHVIIAPTVDDLLSSILAPPRAIEPSPEPAAPASPVAQVETQGSFFELREKKNGKGRKNRKKE